MSLTIRCDGVGDDFRRCTAELTGLPFDSYPEGWEIVFTNHEFGDHMDYCPKHRRDKRRTT